LPIISCCIGSIIYRPTPPVSDETIPNYVIDGWVSLGYPPQKAKKLLGSDSYTVYVETIDEKIYSCYRESPYDVECWVEVANLPDPIQPSCGFSGSYPSVPKSIQVIDKLEAEYCTTVAGQTDRWVFVYLLTDDGEVFQNGYDFSDLWFPAGLSRVIFQGALLGLLIGCVIVVGLFIMMGRWFVS